MAALADLDVIADLERKQWEAQRTTPWRVEFRPQVTAERPYVSPELRFLRFLVGVPWGAIKLVSLIVWVPTSLVLHASLRLHGRRGIWRRVRSDEWDIAISRRRVLEGFERR